ncbi:putative F-box/kelch-repeat protein [Cocos nucifera]|nr:putative F-box/kelch-repeat protein [Cocos nucifera]
MAVGMREGWTGSSVVVDGHLFVISEYERMKVKIYDVETDSWDIVESSPMPEQIRKPFSVNSVGNRIFVVGRGLHVAVGHVEKKSYTGSNGKGKKQSFSIQWQGMDVPQEFGGLTPSSTQVLYA